MASEGSYSSRGSRRLDRGGRNPVAPYDGVTCYCGVASKLLTSGTPSNPGRRFRRCYKMEEEGGCDFFRWVDPPQPEPGVPAIRGRAVAEGVVDAGGVVACSCQRVLCMTWDEVFCIVVVMVMLWLFR